MLLVGGLDIAVAGTIALTVVTLSFTITSGGLAAVIVIAVLVALGVGLAVGTTNALLIEGAKISPVIATIATLGATSGLALILRPTAAGLISSELGRVFKDGPWFLPWPLIACRPCVVVAADIVLWGTGRGTDACGRRAQPDKAQRLGHAHAPDPRPAPTSPVACCRRSPASPWPRR